MSCFLVNFTIAFQLLMLKKKVSRIRNWDHFLLWCSLSYTLKVRPHWYYKLLSLAPHPSPTHHLHHHHHLIHLNHQTYLTIRPMCLLENHILLTRTIITAILQNLVHLRIYLMNIFLALVSWLRLHRLMLWLHLQSFTTSECIAC